MVRREYAVAWPEPNSNDTTERSTLPEAAKSDATRLSEPDNSNLIGRTPAISEEASQLDSAMDLTVCEVIDSFLNGEVVDVATATSDTYPGTTPSQGPLATHLQDLPVHTVTGHPANANAADDAAGRSLRPRTQKPFYQEPSCKPASRPKRRDEVVNFASSSGLSDELLSTRQARAIDLSETLSVLRRIHEQT